MSKWTTHAVLKSNLQLAEIIILSTTPLTDVANDGRFSILEKMRVTLEEARKELSDGARL